LSTILFQVAFTDIDLQSWMDALFFIRALTIVSSVRLIPSSLYLRTGKRFPSIEFTAAPFFPCQADPLTVLYMQSLYSTVLVIFRLNHNYSTTSLYSINCSIACAVVREDARIHALFLELRVIRSTTYFL